MGKNETMERRYVGPFEVRASDDSKEIKVSGHAAVFDQEATIGNWFREVIKPGAFTDAIGRDDVPFLINHDDLPLARTSSGTLKLSQDKIGLRMEATLDGDDPDVQRIVPKMKRGDLSKMSFAFRVNEGEWEEKEGDDVDEDELPLRILRKLELHDVSIVTTPAYDGTDIGLRGKQELDDLRKSKEDDEAEVRKRNNENAKRRLAAKHELDLKVRGIAITPSEEREQD